MSTRPDAPAIAETFATETMAELCVRQGRRLDALAIYRRLVAGPNLDSRLPKWVARLAQLEAESDLAVIPRTPDVESSRSPDADLRTMRAIETMAAQLGDVEPVPRSPALGTLSPAIPSPHASPVLSSATKISGLSASALSPSALARSVEAAAPLPGSADHATPPAEARWSRRLPLLILEPVRSGQIVHAEGTDLIVLAAVNPGAQLLADGNIHVYGPLRGRAIAGASGATAARIFCQRLNAEMVGIDVAYLMADDLPPVSLGKPAQILLHQGRCVVLPL